jgi:long-chain fatty acid transport protein
VFGVGASTARFRPRHVVVSCALVLAAAESRATGFFINQQSVAGLGRVDAGNVAAGSDLGTLFFNPAGLARLWDEDATGQQLDVGAHIIVPRSDLSNVASTATTPGTLGAPLPFVGASAEDPTDPTPVLNLYYARQLRNDDLSLGLRFNSPFGLSAEYEPDWIGRYDSTKAELLTASLGVTLTYRLNAALSIGGGIDLQYADSELVSAIPNPLQLGGPTPASDARFAVEGNDSEVGFNVGLLWQATAELRVGAHYRADVEHDLNGSAATSGLAGPLAPLNGVTDASTSIALPAIASLGVAYEPSGARYTIFGDYTRYGWGDLDTISIRLAGNPLPIERRPSFRDTWSLAAGVDYRLREQLTLRGGIKVDRTPTTDGNRDTTFADDDRLWLAVGGTYERSASFAIDFAFVHVFVDDTEVDVVRTFFDGTPLASSVRTRAAVESVVNTVAMSFRWSF